MKTELSFLAFLIVLSIFSSFAEESAAEGGSSNRGTYLSRGGYIVHPDDIRIEHYIAQRDYNYPLPERAELNVITGSGNTESNTYILIGLKGHKVPFEELPPLNITFCIDRSGSMTQMMPWVKNCFYIFINKVRNGDIVSVVDMNTNAQTLIRPTRIKSESDKAHFKRQVDKIEASGGTNVYAGLSQSYEENSHYYEPGYVNRVVILTDGLHNFGEKVNKDILDLAAYYNQKRDTTVSSVLLGIEANTGLMVDVSIEGGGSSRFVSDHDEMVKIFETELDRMLVPAARSLTMKLVLSEGIELQETWGYQNQINQKTIHYYLPTLHNGDYETIFTELNLVTETTNRLLGQLFIEYQDLNGNQQNIGPYEIMSDYDDMSYSRVREAEGYLKFSRGLIELGDLALWISEKQNELTYATQNLSQKETIQSIEDSLKRSLDLVDELSVYLQEIRNSLGEDKYIKELEILQNYKETFNEVLEIEY